MCVLSSVEWVLVVAQKGTKERKRYLLGGLAEAWRRGVVEGRFQCREGQPQLAGACSDLMDHCARASGFMLRGLMVSCAGAALWDEFGW